MVLFKFMPRLPSDVVVKRSQDDDGLFVAVLPRQTLDPGGEARHHVGHVPSLRLHVLLQGAHRSPLLAFLRDGAATVSRGCPANATCTVVVMTLVHISFGSTRPAEEGIDLIHLTLLVIVVDVHERVKTCERDTVE